MLADRWWRCGSGWRWGCLCVWDDALAGEARELDTYDRLRRGYHSTFSVSGHGVLVEGVLLRERLHAVVFEKQRERSLGVMDRRTYACELVSGMRLKGEDFFFSSHFLSFPLPLPVVPRFFRFVSLACSLRPPLFIVSCFVSFPWVVCWCCDSISFSFLLFLPLSVPFPFLSYSLSPLFLLTHISPQDPQSPTSTSTLKVGIVSERSDRIVNTDVRFLLLPTQLPP